MPSNAPHALGKPVQMILFVDSDHAGDLLSQRVHTRVLIFLNRVPILWYSIKQSGIEASSFGSEFMGLKVVTDLVKGLQYKLRMMGIPIEGPSQVQYSKSMWKKKSQLLTIWCVKTLQLVQLRLDTNLWRPI
jgi:hypothetical protein